jgi:hypothetical protein
MCQASFDRADPSVTSTSSAKGDDFHLHARVSAEFREMPGLKLTLPQAARFFSIDPPQCERVLGALVDRGDLRTDGRAFVRA